MIRGSFHVNAAQHGQVHRGGVRTGGFVLLDCGEIWALSAGVVTSWMSVPRRRRRSSTPPRTTSASAATDQGWPGTGARQGSRTGQNWDCGRRVLSKNLGRFAENHAPSAGTKPNPINSYTARVDSTLNTARSGVPSAEGGGRISSTALNPPAAHLADASDDPLSLGPDRSRDDVPILHIWTGPPR